MSLKEHNTIDIIIYLAACALKDIVPDKEIIKTVDFEKLYKKAIRHSMTVITYMALEKGGFISESYMSAELIAKWEVYKSREIQKILLLEAERSRIQWRMEQMGIWYMPLKGIILKNMYPRLGMRQMADVDILFDKKYQRVIKDLMVERGYEAKYYGKTNHDIYMKKPFYNFEFHRELFGPKSKESWILYYENIKDRLKKNEENNYGYYFSDEDFYIYMIMHTYKHFSDSGTGIRSLMDIYVYIENKGKQLDWNYINHELEFLEVAEFEKLSKTLSYKIFATPEHFSEIDLSKEEESMLEYMETSGTYGTKKNQVQKKLEEIQQDSKPITRKTKFKFYINRIFPDMEWYKHYQPFCYKHRWATPFFWVYRVIRAVLFRRDNIRRDINAVEKTSDKGLK